MSNLCYEGLQSAFFWPLFKISSPTMGGTEHSSKTMWLSKKPSGYMEYKQKNSITVINKQVFTSLVNYGVTSDTMPISSRVGHSLILETQLPQINVKWLYSSFQILPCETIKSQIIHLKHATSGKKFGWPTSTNRFATTWYLIQVCFGVTS